MSTPSNTVSPEIERVERAAIAAWGFDRPLGSPVFPGTIRGWWRSRDEPKKGEFWPKLRVYPGYLELVGYTFEVTIDWYPTTQTYNWHEKGEIGALDRRTLRAWAEAGNLLDAYEADERARQHWPHRGIRGIPHVEKPGKNTLSTDQLDAPQKKGKKKYSGLSAEEIKNAWQT